MYITPNCDTTTREEFTHFYANALPLVTENAHDDFKSVVIAHQDMMKLLCAHPAMDPNRQQIYNTPANSKNKIYFMWDFVGRTVVELQRVDPVRPTGEQWTSCVRRGMMAEMLILDTTGQLEAMNASVGYNDDAGIEFTEEIKQLASKLSGRPA